MRSTTMPPAPRLFTRRLFLQVATASALASAALIQSAPWPAEQRSASAKFASWGQRDLTFTQLGLPYHQLLEPGASQSVYEQ